MREENPLESILSSLSNKTRIEILKLISREGPLSFTEIMEKLQMDPKIHAGKFGYHLKMLNESGLIASDETSGKYYLTSLGQEVSNFVYNIEDFVCKEKSEMLVRTSSLTIEPFDRKKIVEALVREANMPRRLADTISKEAEERLKKSQIKYLTAALIREFVNAILLEKGLEEYRHVLTRLGQPVYDVTLTIKNTSKLGDPSPEIIHSIAGDAVLEEYMLLKVLPRTIADAHLCGMIHLNNANYWVLRPANVFHDIRPILDNKVSINDLVLPYPNKPLTFKEVLFIVNALIRQTMGYVSFAQSIPFFNVFLAPFAKGLDEENIKKLLREFILNLNLLIGSHIPKVSFELEFGIPNFLENTKCIGLDGKQYTYGDFFEESIKIYNALIDVLSETDGSSKPLLNPALFIKIRGKSKSFDKFYDMLIKACKLARKWSNVYFVNQEAPWQTENVSYNLDLSRVDSVNNWEYDTLRIGVLDNVTVNLPRIAYEAKGDDERLKERLYEVMEIAIEALNIKRQVMEEMISLDGIIPLFKENVDGSSYFRLKLSPGIISYIGLYEAVKYHTDNDISEDNDALKLAKDIVSIISDICNRTSMRLLPSIIVFEPVGERLLNLDIKYGYIKSRDIQCYTECSNLPLYIAIELKTRLRIEEEFQMLTKGGHLFDFRLEEPYPTEEVLANYIKRIVETTQLGMFTFTRNYTYCWRCKTINYGSYSRCPNCGYDGNKLAIYSKVYGKNKPSIFWSQEEKDFIINSKSFIL
ncbi:MAG: helix-turn-helix domain-containing protein [Candidatus Verstraetearchaeota archaeon]|nr:helix-turn-helix domain-containing protein [Candidatus Verstraetearchaeota archaeon]